MMLNIRYSDIKYNKENHTYKLSIGIEIIRK